MDSLDFGNWLLDSTSFAYWDLDDNIFVKMQMYSDIVYLYTSNMRFNINSLDICAVYKISAKEFYGDAKFFDPNVSFPFDLGECVFKGDFGILVQEFCGEMRKAFQQIIDENKNKYKRSAADLFGCNWEIDYLNDLVGKAYITNENLGFYDFLLGHYDLDFASYLSNTISVKDWGDYLYDRQNTCKRKVQTWVEDDVVYHNSNGNYFDVKRFQIIGIRILEYDYILKKLRETADSPDPSLKKRHDIYSILNELIAKKVVVSVSSGYNLKLEKDEVMRMAKSGATHWDCYTDDISVDDIDKICFRGKVLYDCR